ncbi:MAG: hypothetical protein OEZ13_11005 [Spirochaetia bacterium]|nr:hypothetical protein [Spirochaetia bacterium]
MRLELKSELEKTIRDENNIRFKMYYFLEETEKSIDFMVSQILGQYNRLEYKAAILTIIKELCKNAVEANLKKIFFDDIEIKIENDFQYKKGKERFEEELKNKTLLETAELAKEKGLYAELNLDYNPHRIIINVINNRMLWPIEEKEIQDNSKKAHKYNNILSFYKEVKKNKNIPKNGITLIMLLLKSENHDAKFFTIEKINAKNETLTSMKIIFPLSREYYK